MATVPGIDVSYWNSGIDWPKVRATGQRFMFTKATEGRLLCGSYLRRKLVRRQSGWVLARGLSLLPCSTCDGKKQAKKFIDYVKTVKDNGRTAARSLTSETHDGQSNGKDHFARAKDLAGRGRKAAFGRKPIIYSGQYFLQDHFSEAGGGPPKWAKDYPLWLAQYPNTYVDGQQPFLPRGWFKWTFWQYSEKGRLNGINASVDLKCLQWHAGGIVQICGRTDHHPAAPEAKKHTVKAGDTFESIAIKYGVTVRELVSANLQLLKKRRFVDDTGRCGDTQRRRDQAPDPRMEAVLHPRSRTR
jgi:lysozyme